MALLTPKSGIRQLTVYLDDTVIELNIISDPRKF